MYYAQWHPGIRRPRLLYAIHAGGPGAWSLLAGHTRRPRPRWIVEQNSNWRAADCNHKGSGRHGNHGVKGRVIVSRCIVQLTTLRHDRATLSADVVVCKSQPDSIASVAHDVTATQLSVWWRHNYRPSWRHHCEIDLWIGTYTKPTVIDITQACRCRSSNLIRFNGLYTSTSFTYL